MMDRVLLRQTVAASALKDNTSARFPRLAHLTARLMCALALQEHILIPL